MTDMEPDPEVSPNPTGAAATEEDAKEGPPMVDIFRVPTIHTNPDDLDFRPQDLEDLRRVFDYFDKDGSESIEASELTEVLKSLGMKNAPSADDLLSISERSGGDAIDWEDFLQIVKAVWRKGEVQGQEELKKAHSPVASGSGLSGLGEPSAPSATSSTPLHVKSEDELEVEREEKEMVKIRLEAIESSTTKWQRRRLTFGIISLFFLSYLPVGMMPVLADIFRDDLGLSDFELGLLPFAYMAGFASFTLLIAIVETRVGTVYGWVVFFLFVNAVVVAFTSTATSFAALMAFRAATGCANCVFGIFMFPLLYALEPYSPLLWSGVANAMIPLALGVGYSVPGWLLGSGVSWPTLFIAVGILIGVAALYVALNPMGFRAFQATKDLRTRKPPSYIMQLRKIYCNAFNLSVALIASQFYVLITAVQYWIVLFYIDVIKVSRAEAAFTSGALMVTTAFAGSLFGAAVMSKLDAGVRGSAVFFGCVCIVVSGGLIVFATQNTKEWIYPATAVIFFSLTSHLPLINDIPIKVLAPSYQAFGSSRLSLVQGLFGAIGPAVTGVIIDNTSQQTMWAILIISAALALVASILAFAFAPTHEKAVHKREEMLTFWAGLIKRLSAENNSVMHTDHVVHANYRRMFAIVQRYTPHASHDPASPSSHTDPMAAELARTSSSMPDPNAGANAVPSQSGKKAAVHKKKHKDHKDGAAAPHNKASHPTHA